MKIAIHLGVHCTDQEQLLRSLLMNKEKLAKHGVDVPGPGKYRALIQTSIQKLDGHVASAETESLVLEEILDNQDASVLVMSWDNFICVPSRVFDNGTLYDQAAFKTAAIRNLFPSCEVAFFFGLINPATLIPGLMSHKTQWHKRLPKLLQGATEEDLSWHDMIGRVRAANPETDVTVWCNEDTPLIWPEIMQSVTMLDPPIPLRGSLYVVSQIMEKDGFKALGAHLKEQPPENEAQRRDIVSNYLARFIREDALISEIEIPEWSAGTVDVISELYDAEINDIQKMPGIKFIAP